MLVGSNIKERFYNFFIPKLDNNLIGLSGLAGNIQAESEFKTTNLQDSYEKPLGMTDDTYTKGVDSGTYTNFVKDKAGYGLAQWTYWSRKEALLNLARSKKVSISDEEMQMEMLYNELVSQKLIDGLKKAKTIREASNLILFKFEAPADQSKKVQDLRTSYGEAYYKLFSNTPIKESSTDQISATPAIKIEQVFATQNPCYRAGRKTKKTGIMLHSVGCPQPNPKAFVEAWKSANASTGVHFVIGVEPVAYQLLPYDVRAWHCGSGSKGSGNDNLISVEMTEPASIKYTSGANWVETGDGTNTKAHVLATYNNAVALFAHICKETGISPSNIISHHEGNVKGIASNHGDVEHIWNKFGLTMEEFRNDVASALKGVAVEVPVVSTAKSDTSGQKVNSLSGTLTIIYAGNDGINVRKAPSITATVTQVLKKGAVCTVTGISADEKWYRISTGEFITATPEYVSFKATQEQKKATAGTGYYRVQKSWGKNQIGAFKDLNNAIDLCKANSGYKVFDASGKEVYPCTTASKETFKFKVTAANLRIRKGAGTTFDYHKDSKGKALYTGKGVFTIVKTKKGAGAKLWGLLSSYAKEENGWISLDEEFGKRT